MFRSNQIRWIMVIGVSIAIHLCLIGIIFLLSSNISQIGGEYSDDVLSLSVKQNANLTAN